MRVVGIVCEYNPFHRGHEHQIKLLRQSGAELIVCAMSGNFSERGEITVADKYTRAEAAIRCGCDIVLELPFPYSSFSAEGFCSAGVHVLSSVGCDTLSFGSESADARLLDRAADAVLSESFVRSYTESDRSLGSARAYFDLLSEHLGEDVTLLSNGILGISYVAAIKRQKLNMEIFPIKRLGSAYNESKLGDIFPSATAIRQAVKGSAEGFFALSEDHLPKDSLDTLKSAQTGGLAPIFTDKIGSDILSFFKLMTPDEIISRAAKRSRGGSTVAEDGCGIVQRLCNCAKAAKGFDEFVESAYNSRYTDARINRVILFSLLGVSDIFEKTVPEYTTLLGANEKGRKYLSEIRKTADLPIITKPADAPDINLTEILTLSDSLYASAMPKDVNFDHFFKKHPFIG
jgi:predicted nucleotidyltransferase